jgi:L-fuconolactonase
LVIDSQIHVWPRSFTFSHERIEPDALVARMSAAGVDRAVLVPPTMPGYPNDYALSVARDYPQRFQVMGRIDLAAPDPARILRWRDQPGMAGIRLIFHKPPDSELLSKGEISWFWEHAEAADIPVMVFAPGRETVIAGLAERHPGLRLCLDHLNLGLDAPGDRLAGALQPVIALSRYKNITVKATGLQKRLKEPYPFTALHAPLRDVIAAFGPERVFWGTDLSQLPCSYAQAVDLFMRELHLPPDDREEIMGKAIARWLDWP